MQPTYGAYGAYKGTWPRASTRTYSTVPVLAPGRTNENTRGRPGVCVSGLSPPQRAQGCYAALPPPSMCPEFVRNCLASPGVPGAHPRAHIYTLPRRVTRYTSCIRTCDMCIRICICIYAYGYAYERYIYVPYMRMERHKYVHMYVYMCMAMHI